MTIKFYFSSTAGSLQIKHQQSQIELILTAKSIEYEKIDISASEEAKNKMKELIGDSSAIAPQLFNEDEYCGNYDALAEANELDTVEEFLKIA